MEMNPSPLQPVTDVPITIPINGIYHISIRAGRSKPYALMSGDLVKLVDGKLFVNGAPYNERETSDAQRPDGTDLGTGEHPSDGSPL